jgi:uncharacterized protein (UPF0261 family)
MLTLPFRLAASLFITLFIASSLVRRAVAGVAVSAMIVAAQHEQAFNAFTAAAEDESAVAATLTALAMFIRG